VFLLGFGNNDREALGARGREVARGTALYELRERVKSVIAERIADLIRRHLSRYT